MKNYTKEQVWCNENNINQILDVLQLYTYEAYLDRNLKGPREILTIDQDLLDKADKAWFIYWDDVEGPMFGNVPVEVRL